MKKNRGEEIGTGEKKLEAYNDKIYPFVSGMREYNLYFLLFEAKQPDWE